MIHQSKSLYNIGPSQTCKAEFFTEIVFGYKPLTVFLKISNLDVLMVSQDASKKTFYILFGKILCHVIPTPVCLRLLFQKM